MSKHPTNLFGVPPAELGRQLANLRYDALAAVLGALGERLFNDFLADKQRDRSQLAASLYDASNSVLDAHICIKEAWRICEPFEKAKAEADL